MAPPIQRLATCLVFEVARNIPQAIVGIEVLEHQLFILCFTTEVNVVIQAHLLEDDNIINNARVGRHENIRVGIGREQILHFAIIFVLVV